MLWREVQELRLLCQFDNRYIGMELISSVLSIVKNVNDTDREFRILRDKLVYHIKKAEICYQKYLKQGQVYQFQLDNLKGRIRDAEQCLAVLDNLLNSSQQKISFTDRIKLSLPFNSEREKATQAIEDLRQTLEDMTKQQLPVDIIPKRPIQIPVQQPNLDAEIDQLYEMGPTIQENNALDFAMQFAKNHTLELKVQTLGSPEIIAQLSAENKQIIVEKTYERVSKEDTVEVFQLGRMNFKKQYKVLRPVFPDIDKISKLSHFRILWKRHVTANEPVHKPHEHLIVPNESTIKKTEIKGQSLSQRKDQVEQFFSVPQGAPEEISNGAVVLQKEKRSLYRRCGNKWTKTEQEAIQVINGQEVAISLNKDLEADLYFKITYRFK